MAYVIKKKDDGDKVLKQFNYFHDGFIKELRLLSHDYFDPNKNQVCLGVFDVCIDFAHYNYNGDNIPFNQIIRAYFYDIKDFNLELQEIKEGDWSIVRIEFEEIERVNIKNETVSSLVIKITFDFYDEKNSEWIKLEKSLFSFKEARFVELEKRKT